MSNHYADIDGYSLADFIHELPFYLGNVMKYAWRAPLKGCVDDTLKLIDYLAMARAQWVEYRLSDSAIECLSEISRYDFYSGYEGLDRAHRRVIASAATLILDSEGAGAINKVSEKILEVDIPLLQIALKRNKI